ncbi:DEAD/DEAH box helicase [Methylophaga sp. OBS1]|uniref:DEAD/DEAH box helicase n=1 Tax=Methylophaga sp. OBS1 TaxID=2991933 RepID=UPI0022565652|nr:type ISP restriction/modification enzyme [Methylophaga sp. OBS1]MCX4192575.1 DEAD/DEAH box helicase family protein [Methylophaga sp. OBS1]
MSALREILDSYRTAAVTEREKGTYFEELMICYLRNEASYRDLYSEVWTYADWAKSQGLDGRDTGIDLVAKTAGTDEYHAIQCKLYAEDYKLQKRDIDSFFTASGKKPFTHRIIVSTTNHWSEHAEEAIRDQQPPVSKIDLHDLENSQIDWSTYQYKAIPELKPKFPLRPHQETALNSVKRGLENADRGKLIMACGTGKTFTSLKIAEELAGKGKRVLFLVPSLSLLSQTLTEWTQQSTTLLHSFAVCSDSDVGKKRKQSDDTVQTFTHELRYPSTTEPSRLASEIDKRHDAQHMSVVFSTYHSIDVISKAQHEHDLGDFDLIICDEAHRTTGATFDDEDESAFVRVHDNSYIRAKKRLYMTATPRIYGEVAKEIEGVTLCSMDNEKLYGKDLYVITFSEAVKRGLLVDYKVIVLSIEESHVSRRIQSLLKDEDNQLKVDDAAKIIGCWKALSKQGLEEDLKLDANAMKRAVAFCQVIELSKGSRTHKVSSKQIANMFQAVVDAYQESDEEAASYKLKCQSEHVDGSMNASEKEAKLEWLKAEPPEETCRILSNVRCLSEGVDVPALDAVLFLTPRNSQVDVVQSVGRVMRNAPGKERGYVIMPVVIPAGVEAHEALNDNKTYRVVWQVLQALRSHDDRFDAMVNKLDLIGQDTSKMEVVAITDKVEKKQKKTKGKTKRQTGQGGFNIGTKTKKPQQDQGELQFEIGEVEKAIYAKLVQKVGNRGHWEEWANDIAKIARTHIDRIRGILENADNKEERAAFEAFAEELRDDLNDSINDEEIIEMLAQHLVTKPVFDALFEGYSFAEQNPMSQAMQSVLDALHDHHIGKEAETLQAFYESVKLRAEGIDNAAGKQKIVVELYDKFFRNAFPRMTERLGIVYTPVEVVDFIIHSVNDVLQSEFGQTLGGKGVHIIDPFTGTGSFITRLMQSGLIDADELRHKYGGEIHANEIVLLAYYIAAINIEAVYHSIIGGEYRPFEGICLTDTFQMYEKEDLVDVLLEDNSARRKRQKALDIKVIIGNPPYSAGQKKAGDGTEAIKYDGLDRRISETYVANSSKAGGKRASYNSFVRAIRWASDRIGDSGVIGFVVSASFIESVAADGMRKCLHEEFDQIYIFNLRGNQRTSGEESRKEGGKIFDSGSREPAAICLFVKNKQAKAEKFLKYKELGDYLKREEKLELIREYGSISSIDFMSILPDEHGDWISQRDDSFEQHMTLGSKQKDSSSKIFKLYSNGVVSSRDAWVFNYSKSELLNNCKRMISFFNDEIDRYKQALNNSKESIDPQKFVTHDQSQISWGGSSWIPVFKRLEKQLLEPKDLGISLYRPYTKLWHYGSKVFNHSFYSMKSIFPEKQCENIVICVTGRGANKGFSALASNLLPDLEMIAKGQCFPLYLYEETRNKSRKDLIIEGGQVQGSLFDEPHGELFEHSRVQSQEKVYKRKDALTDEGLSYFQSRYSDERITKEDLFYYIYGLLHSEDYRDRFADNLSKELPRIPTVKKVEDFWAFSKAGRDLAKLHLNYETVEPYSAKVTGGGEAENYRVEKMKYGKNKDKTTLHYNNKITVTGIPLEAYDYVVNGKPALDWVVERQSVKTDKASDIVNDANDWAIETMDNPRYPLELFLRVITVSLETMKIVRSLPPLDI